MAKQCHNPRLALDCQWRLGLWEELHRALAAPTFPENTTTGIIKAYDIVRVNPTADNVEHQLARIRMHLQDEWTLLPPHCINPKVAVLQRMHQMSEVDESFKIVRDIRRHSENGVPVRPPPSPCVHQCHVLATRQWTPAGRTEEHRVVRLQSPAAQYLSLIHISEPTRPY